MSGPPGKQLLSQRFHRLVVIASHHSNRRRKWLCRCDCGNTAIVTSSQLVHGLTKSCGCFRNERAVIHGHARPQSATYKSWHSMVDRCSRPGATSWRYYGGLGVKVCARWLDFANFLEDMGVRPPGLTLDRIDPYGNYEPGNCRWATWIEQRANRRDSVRVSLEKR